MKRSELLDIRFTEKDLAGVKAFLEEVRKEPPQVAVVSDIYGEVPLSRELEKGKK